MPQITAGLLEKLEAWRRAGDRAIKIELGRWGELEIWIYDYDIQGGAHIDEANVDKDWDVLIVANKRNDLKKELAALDKRMGGLA